MVEVAERADWDQLETLSETLLPALDTINQALKNSAKLPVDRDQIEKSLVMLQLVTDKFITRRSQIAPLIAALTAAKKAPEAS